jgi:alkylresorcinol/alkylpyrone synthase
VMFILRELLHDDSLADGSTIAGLAFGPGLTVESALLTKRKAAVAPASDGGRQLAVAG